MNYNLNESFLDFRLCMSQRKSCIPRPLKIFCQFVQMTTNQTKIRKIGFVITTLPIHFKEQPKPKVFRVEFSYLRTKPEIVTCQCILESRKYHNMKTV